MNNWLLGFLVLFSATAAGEAYLLLGRVRVFLKHAEQLSELGQRLTAELPSKSARHTDADDDIPTGSIELPDLQTAERPRPTPHVRGRHRSTEDA